MALRAAAARFGFSTGFSKRKEPSIVPRSGGALAAFAQIKRLARQNGSMMRTYHLSRRELPNITRRRQLLERVYYKRWHHLKYCTQVIRYSVKRGLPMQMPGSEMTMPTVRFAEGVEPPVQGTGRLHKEDFATLDERELLSAMHREEYWEPSKDGDNDVGFSEDQLRKIAEGTWSPYEKDTGPELATSEAKLTKLVGVPMGVK
eukprot:NODE_16119_length_1011_cov_5.608597.p1 GENE.NODE_16119_length_1011_cov_5.608597~~NODE_16119_length_1011_cov_5.608597.p1  ORF type:complete len:203 (-),score=55.98 NODE_16119_length_1011_cov_5.608597:173-781(-)